MTFDMLSNFVAMQAKGTFDIQSLLVEQVMRLLLFCTRHTQTR